MDKDTSAYIANYFSHLFTVKEKMAMKHCQHMSKLGSFDGSETDKLNQPMGRAMLKIGWLSTDKKILDLAKDGYEKLELDTARRILAEYAEKIFLNNCPVCGRLPRTLLAKQCRFCGHNWHDLTATD
jgi:hypothetical protein